MTRGSERCFKVFSLDLNQIMLSALIAPTYLGPAHSGVWLQGHANWAPDRIFPDEHRRGEPVAVLFDNTRLKQHVLALWSYFAVHACGSLTHVCHDQTDCESGRIDPRPQSLDRGSHSCIAGWSSWGQVSWLKGEYTSSKNRSWRRQRRGKSQSGTRLRQACSWDMLLVAHTRADWTQCHGPQRRCRRRTPPAHSGQVARLK